jgi:ribosomal protein S18 acetylase RimI-like enzyme
MNAMAEDPIWIRDYRSSDYGQIMELWNETGLGGRNRGDDQKTIEHSLELGGKMIVAEDTAQEKVVGTSWMTFDGRRIHLHHIGVLPQYRNRGLGKRLTIESLRFAKARGYQIKLEVRQDNTRAIGLYKELGFQRLGDYDVYIVRDLSRIDV